MNEIWGKVELLPTRDCNAGYDPAACKSTCSLQIHYHHRGGIISQITTRPKFLRFPTFIFFLRKLNAWYIRLAYLFLCFRPTFGKDGLVGNRHSCVSCCTNLKCLKNESRPTYMIKDNNDLIPDKFESFFHVSDCSMWHQCQKAFYADIKRQNHWPLHSGRNWSLIVEVSGTDGCSLNSNWLSQSWHWLFELNVRSSSNDFFSLKKL